MNAPFDLRELRLAVFAILLLPASLAVSSACYGTTAHGRLEGGCQLPRSGPNFAPYAEKGLQLGPTFVHCTVAEIVSEASARAAE